MSCPIHPPQVSDLITMYLRRCSVLIESEGRKHIALSYVNQPSSTKHAAHQTGVVLEACTEWRIQPIQRDNVIFQILNMVMNMHTLIRKCFCCQVRVMRSLLFTGIMLRFYLVALWCFYSFICAHSEFFYATCCTSTSWPRSEVFNPKLPTFQHSEASSRLGLHLSFHASSF